MRRVSFLVVVVALLGALFVSGCAGVDGGSMSPTAPSTPQNVPTDIRPLDIKLANGLPAEDGSTLPFDGSLVVDLQYTISPADIANVSLSQVWVGVCLAGPVEGTILFTACDINGYKTTGRDTFYVSQARVLPEQRLKETPRVVYFISTAFHTSLPAQAIPPNSGNYSLFDSFDVVKWGYVAVRVVWR